MYTVFHNSTKALKDLPIFELTTSASTTFSEN